MKTDTHVVNIGGIEVGGSNPIVIQSMTDTDTSDIINTVSQIEELYNAGSQIVRVTVNNTAAAKAIEILNLGKADAKSIEYKESARLEMYKTLSTAANMTVEEIMQYDWITSSSKASDGNDVFIDYNIGVSNTINAGFGITF